MNKVDTINGKTPEEIKCGMECIRTNAERICVKPEKGQCPRCKQIVQDHINLIHYLESRLAQAERERDAAVADLENVIGLSAIVNLDCEFCKHMDRPTCEECDWEWRGVCPKNTKEDAE